MSKDSLAELEVFLEKSGIGEAGIKRYRHSLQVLLGILEEKSLALSAIDAPDVTNLFFTKDRSRREKQLAVIRKFLLYKGVLQKQPQPHEKPGTTLDAAVAAFLKDLACRNYVPRTIKNYHSVLASFTEFCRGKEVVHTGELAKQHIGQYQMTLFTEEERYSFNAKVNILYQVRHFLRFLHQRGEILADLGAFIEIPKTEKKLSRNFFKREEISSLFAVIDTTTAWGFRDRTLFELLYSSGLRAGEAFRLVPEDIDFEQGTLVIREGKGGRDRVVPLTGTALAYLRMYAGCVRPGLLAMIHALAELNNHASTLREAGVEPDTLFFNQAGKSDDGSNTGWVLRQYLQQAGISPARSPHAFRYSCATHMLENGADIRHIADLLGHRKIDTTGGYTKVLTGNLIKAIAHHPRGRIQEKGGEVVFIPDRRHQ